MSIELGLRLHTQAWCPLTGTPWMTPEHLAAADAAMRHGSDEDRFKVGCAALQLIERESILASGGFND